MTSSLPAWQSEQKRCLLQTINTISISPEREWGGSLGFAVVHLVESRLRFGEAGAAIPNEASQPAGPGSKFSEPSVKSWSGVSGMGGAGGMGGMGGMGLEELLSQM